MTGTKTRGTSWRRQRGQALVELALTLPIVLALMMGTVDVGFVLFAHVQVAAASYEGARVGSQYPGNLAEPLTLNDTAREGAMRTAVVGALGRLNASDPLYFVPSSDVTFTYYPPSPAQFSTRTGDEMMVTVRYRQPVWFALLSGISNGSFQTATSTRMRIR